MPSMGKITAIVPESGEPPLPSSTTVEWQEKAVAASSLYLPLCSFGILVKGLLAFGGVAAATTYSISRVVHLEGVDLELQRKEAAETAGQLLSGLQRQLETSVYSTEALAALLQLNDDVLMAPHGAAVWELVMNTSSYVSAVEESSKDSSMALEAKATLDNAKQRILSSRFDFNAVADSLIKTYKGITNLQLAPSGVVSIIHPLAGNEKAIGHDLFFDKNRREGAVRAITAGKVVFVGPITLIQNGRKAILARNPVFINKPGFKGPRPEFPSWWGFSTMLCELDDLLAPTQLSSAEMYGLSYVLYAVTGKGNTLLATSKDVPEEDWQAHAEAAQPVNKKMELPDLNVEWVLSSWPRDGWKRHGDGFRFNLSLCACFTLTSILSVYSMLLRESVIERLRSLAAASKYPAQDVQDP
eukprot:TRINITY_DN27400_c0_g1_i1.p1 TRINITY_DN27400_c0_g1~~TRINITY_DN27400_c0_g1_i1.p1  ORF type:complete len:433 (+),score=96.91 TRINITY_DN27400_c0_g1_i1:58-1299(+)